MTRVVVLAGGVGGSRFVVGVRAALRQRGASDATSDRLTVVVNTGDDLWLSGLRLQPDVDSMIYTLAGEHDPVRGWGRTGESERVATELTKWDAGWPWFTLGDLDLGAHIARTGWLRDGYSVTEVVQRLSARWPLGATLLPMTNDEVDTYVHFRSGEQERKIHFQEWWTRYRASIEPLFFENPGIESARPGDGVVEAVRDADVILVAPSNPVVSIGPILAIPGIRAAIAQASAPVVGVSPIIRNRVLRGMADVCLRAVGVEASAAGVARHYGSRVRGGLLDVWLVAPEDAESAGMPGGVAIVATPLVMTDHRESARIAAVALDHAAKIRRTPT